MMKKKKEKRSRILKDFFGELSGNVIADIFVNIIMFIPRVFIRLLKDIW